MITRSLAVRAVHLRSGRHHANAGDGVADDGEPAGLAEVLGERGLGPPVRPRLESGVQLRLFLLLDRGVVVVVHGRWQILGVAALAGAVVVREWVLLLDDALSLVTVAADHSGRDSSTDLAFAFGSVEDERSDDVEDAEGEGEDARGEYEAPHGKSEVVHGVGRLDEIAHDGAAHDDHGQTEPYQRMTWAEDGPVPGKEIPEGPDVQLGDEEKDGDGEDEEVRSRVEEVEASTKAGEDNHDPRGRHGHGEANEGESSKSIED